MNAPNHHPHAEPLAYGFSAVKKCRLAKANGIPGSLCVSRQIRYGNHRIRLIPTRM